MKKYLYTFGYFTPAQWLSNEEHGWDDECSAAYFIVAESSDLALHWGRKLSEAFVKHLFGASDLAGSAPTWREGRFTHWIETSPEIVAAMEGSAPIIECGKYPDFSEMFKV